MIMKRFPILLPLLLFLLGIWGSVPFAAAQGVRSGQVHCDSRYLEYSVHHGVATENGTVFRQTLIDSLGNAHTEVYYTTNHHVPDNYTWNFFEGRRRVRTERYRAGKMLYRKVFTYGKEGRIVAERVYEPRGNGDTVLAMRVEYKYKRGNLVKREGRDAEGRRVFRVKAKYKKGSPYYVSLRTKGRDPYDSLWVQEVTRRDIVLDSQKRPVQMVEEKVDGEGKRTEYLYRIQYLPNGLETQRDFCDPKTGGLIQRLRYTFYPSGYPNRKYLYDGKGVLQRSWRHYRVLFPSGSLNQPFPEEL